MAKKTEAAEPKTTAPPPEDGFCVYLGPSIRGVIQNGTVYPGDKAAVLAQLTDALRFNPLIASLIVSGGALPASRVQAKTPGNLLYANCTKVKAGLKT